MILELHGHDCRYGAEQALMSYLPEAYAGEGRLDSTFDEAAGLATARLQWGDRVAVGEVSGAPLPADPLERERERQKRVKRSVYRACVALSGAELPWGSLTGVRPGKLAARWMGEHGRDRGAAARFLETEYDVSPRRAALCADAALMGLAVQDRLRPGDIILYVGIPFCPTRCAYCSFVSHSVEKSLKLVEPYVDALEREIRGAAALCREAGLKVRAVYWGGGTPTTLGAEQLRRLMGELSAGFDLSENLEYTVEAGRPDTITREKLLALRDGGVSRISINPQSMDDRVLETIGRRHTVQAIYDGYALARDTLDCAVNMDLIAGLPGDSCEGFVRSLESVLELEPENVTVHTLTRKRGADLNHMALESLDGDTVGQMLEHSLRLLPAAGHSPYYLYRQKFSVGGYENVGWCKPGTACFYNVAMMEELCSVLSLGAGGATKRNLPGGRLLRCFNKKYPYEYCADVEASLAAKRKLLLPETKEK